MNWNDNRIPTKERNAEAEGEFTWRKTLSVLLFFNLLLQELRELEGICVRQQ